MSRLRWVVTARLLSSEAFRKVSADHVAERLATLEYAGLVHRVETTSFELATDVERSLVGNFDAERQPLPRRV
ncbi:hypothetical protein [Natranaeroarchaeum aerophilus]|uniref:Uncharacterized protein n=1 Tax=Natranaeroarchaeum aerophilus TaxID=2917711 RepID=A0AAE3FTS9_9EURY|nr:hypothetical protein [Natranaeroarchaeum aerophilus]MCL9814444.1 hypothetical protein [Natranaeroarchaeum aerophilus]